MITEEQVEVWWREYLIDHEMLRWHLYLANKAAEFEREECAALCDSIAAGRDADAIAEAIRKRGEK